MTTIVTQNKGTLHKFDGDMIMAFWNVLLPDEHATFNSVCSGIEMQKAAWMLGQRFEAEGHLPVHIGVGINTGTFAGGNIGGKDRVEYTVIGDNINLGKRIESQAGRWQVFVSEESFKQLGKKSIAIGLPSVQVKGKSAEVKIYSIRAIEVEPSLFSATIPILIKNSDGIYTQEGLITQMKTSGDTLSITLFSSAHIEEEDSVSFKLNLPEMALTEQCTGTASYVDKEHHLDCAIYSHCTLSNLILCDSIEKLFVDGGYFESDRKWDDMKRH